MWKIPLILSCFALSFCSKGKRDQEEGGAERSPEPSPTSTDDFPRSPGPVTPSAGPITNSPSPSPTPTPHPPLWPDPLTDAQAVEAVKKLCADCHNKDSGKYKDKWAFVPAEVSKDTIKNDPLAHTVYQAISAKALGVTGKVPIPMPFVDQVDQTQLKALMRWFHTQLPRTVEKARLTYGTLPGDDQTIVVSTHKCENPITLRKFLHKTSLEFFDESPRFTADFSAVIGSNGASLDQTVTLSQRQQTADQLATSLLNKFETITLKKFAKQLGDTNQISLRGGINTVQVEDLKNEFYMLLLNDYKTKSFRDILLTDHVYVKSSTSSLYAGCTARADTTTWYSCPLTTPRGSYFSTIGFMVAHPSSFLTTNNNYGRVKALYFAINGEVFTAGLSADPGAPVNALPSCLKTKDWRGTKVDNTGNLAPYGTGLIPLSGNTCQSCHIDRHLASGSILFRPFNATGILYGDKAPLAFDPNFAAATDKIQAHKPDNKGAPQPVNEAFLKSLLSGEQACIAKSTTNSSEKVIKSLHEFAEHLIGDGRPLAVGMARHLSRILGQTAVLSEELLDATIKSYNNDSGKLLPLFQAYLKSETFICSGI